MAREEKKYACEGGKVHTYSDMAYYAAYDATSTKHEVIRVRNSEFDEMEDLI